MNDRIHTTWRDRIASELKGPTTYDDLGLSIGPDIHIESTHVQAPDPLVPHELTLKPIRYEPLVRSVTEFRMLRSLDPDIPGPGLIHVRSAEYGSDDQDAPDGVGDVNIYCPPDTGIQASRDLISRSERDAGFAGAGLLIDPLAFAHLSSDEPDNIEPVRDELIRNDSSRSVIGCVDALAMDSAGAAAPTTVAWTLLSLSAWIDHMDAGDLSPGGRMERLRILAPVGVRPIVDAAVLTVIRDLSSALIRLYSEENDGPERPVYPVLHAVSSRSGIVRSAAPADDVGNLVRGTLQAVAAASAGADILSLQPYDTHRDPTPDSVRLSAGIHRVLRHESRLDRTAHPFSGSYAFETMVRNISDLAWERFVELFRRGAPLESIRSGLLDEWLRVDRDGADHPLRVGVDKYVPELEREEP